MKHLDLFSGIGGFALAARWMEWETVQFVEIDKFCQKVLAKNFPNIPIHGDIKTFIGKYFRGTVDILTGGFPCQPFSTAGKRKGTEDDRHLWPEMLRVIGEVQPSYIVGENVSGILNWSGGLVFEQVQTDLENKGYEVTSFVLPACSADAWHRRDRIWFIAHFNGYGFENEIISKEKGCKRKAFSQVNSVSTNTDSIRFEGRNKAMYSPQEKGYDQKNSFTRELRQDWQRNGLPSPTICGMDDGIPTELYIIGQAIKNEIKISDKKGKPEKSFVEWKAMREMWRHKEIAETSPELFINRVCNSLSIVPRKSGSIGWLQENKEAKELRGLWESFYSKSYQEAQDLQCKMLELLRKIERGKKMEQEQVTNRIKALGNAVVPQVVYEIYKAIEQVTVNYQSADL